MNEIDYKADDFLDKLTRRANAIAETGKYNSPSNIRNVHADFSPECSQRQYEHSDDDDDDYDLGRRKKIYELLASHYGSYVDAVFNSLEEDKAPWTLPCVGEYDDLHASMHSAPPNADNGLTAIEWYCRFLSVGLIPPPEILICIKDTFGAYFSGRGKVSLEKAFFGKPKSGRGNYAKRREADYRYNQFHTYMQFGVFEDATDSSVEGQASQYLKTSLFSLRLRGELDASEKFEREITAFVRGYWRWKKRTFSD